jgi:hypothetical protein
MTTVAFELQEKLASLESLIKEKHPRMPTLLQEIHSALRAQPENVVLLSEDEIQVIIEGLEIQTGVKLAEAAVSKSSKPGTAARLKKITEDDL